MNEAEIKEPEKSGVIGELETFLTELKSYRRYLDPNRLLMDTQKRYRDSLREKLVRKSGALKGIIIELTGKSYVKGGLTGRFDMWSEAFNTTAFSSDEPALAFCIQNTNEAIGKLEADIERGIRDKQGTLIKKLSTIPTEPPKAFISHGKESVALKKLEDFLHNLGILPLIVKEQPSLDKTVSDKVEYYLQQSDFVIILATGDDEFEGKLHPRQNVIHEIGLAQKAFAGKIIYLLEEKAEFPSNISPKVWERFKQRNMLNAFLCILRELRALGILLAVKPQ